MAHFDDSIKEEIRSRLDIVSVIGRYVQLKQVGSTFKGLCPFHKEKTPSFHVNPSRGFFHCFGCGKGGDVFAFLEDIEGLTFYETLTMLGEECGVEVKPQRSDNHSASNNRSSGTKAGFSKMDFLRIHQMAENFFYQTMKKSPEAIEYFKSRGLLPEIVKEFRLGFAGGSWTSLFDFFSDNGIDKTLLIECGLAVCKTAPRCYDRFRNRIIFPLNDLSGRVIGFAGRAIDKENNPKYLNSPETPLYKKKKFLYGLHKARQAIKEQGCIIVVEGYMDYLALYQVGIRNIVATSGTALTSEHGQLIRRFTKNVILLFDGDTAGQSAIEKAIFTLVPYNLEISTVSLPDDEDPDSFIKKYGPDEFKHRFSGAQRWTDFILDRMIRQHNISTPSGKSTVVEALSPLIRTIQDPIVLHQFVKIISDRLDLPERLIRGNVSSLPSGQGEDHTLHYSHDLHFMRTLEGSFLHILVAKPEFINEARTYVLPETLTDTLSANIYSLLLKVYDRDHSLERVSDGVDDTNIIKVLSLLMVKDIIHVNVHEELVQKIIHLRKKYLRSRQRECKILMMKESHRREELLRLLHNYTTQLHELDGGE